MKAIGEIMVSTSASGIGYAARIWALAAGRTRLLAILVTAPLFLAANAPAPLAPPNADLTVSFTGLRSSKGLIRGCLTRNPAFFPNCDKDPQSLKASVPASPNARMHFTDMPAGDYALSILHDENANARLDTMLGIPKEGVGFSENPRLRFSAPKFDAARFRMGSTNVTKEVRLQYFL
jgi:uncharacterized protein (DUF2141 family)